MITGQWLETGRRAGTGANLEEAGISGGSRFRHYALRNGQRARGSGSASNDSLSQRKFKKYQFDSHWTSGIKGNANHRVSLSRGVSNPEIVARDGSCQVYSMKLTVIQH